MIKTLNKITHKSLEKSDLKNSILSIQISLDGFSFCVYDTVSKTLLAFYEFDFDSADGNPATTLELIETIFEDNLLLQQKYNSIKVSYHNNLATIVPKEHFNEQFLNTYLKSSIKVLKNDFIAHDELVNTKAHVVYIPYVNINNFLFSKFGEFEYFHASSILIDTLTKQFSNESSPIAFISVQNNIYYLIVIKEGSLLFYNAFKHQTAADFIYYILFSFEQLELDPDKIETFLLGTIEKESEMYTIAHQYIRNLKFYNTVNPILKDDFEAVSKHTYVTLFNQI